MNNRLTFYIRKTDMFKVNIVYFLYVSTTWAPAVASAIRSPVDRVCSQPIATAFLLS